MTKEEIFKYIGCTESNITLDEAITKYAKDKNLCQVLFFDAPTYTLYYKCRNGKHFKIDRARNTGKAIIETFEPTDH